MDSAEKALQFQMGISAIKVVSYSQNEWQEVDTLNKDLIEFQTDFEIKVKEEVQVLSIISTVFIKSKDSTKIFVELKTVVDFNILPFHQVVAINGDKVSLPDPLLLNLFNIVIGTVRGILHEKLRGSILQNEMLPLIDLKQMIKVKK